MKVGRVINVVFVLLIFMKLYVGFFLLINVNMKYIFYVLLLLVVFLFNSCVFICKFKGVVDKDMIVFSLLKCMEK